MAETTGIEWTDSTWNVLVGCDKVSPGCDHCYAIRTAHRMTANPNPKVSTAYAGTEADGEWTGVVNLLDARLDQPLRWSGKPRRIFVNAQSDMFHAEVPDEFIARVWAVMALTPMHTYQILTKRPGRMRSLLSSLAFQSRVQDSAYLIVSGEDPDVRAPGGNATYPVTYPLPNVWLGTSVEDQKRALLRVPSLLATPAAARFISAEPLLGPVDLTRLDVESRSNEGMYVINALTGENRDMGRPCRPVASIDWVIVGGESGPGARPMHPAWARSLRDQCEAAKVAYLFKQWGDWTPIVDSETFQSREPDAYVSVLNGRVADEETALANGGGWAGVHKVGKRAAGRVLDGATYDGYPDA